MATPDFAAPACAALWPVPGPPSPPCPLPPGPVPDPPPDPAPPDPAPPLPLASPEPPPARPGYHWNRHRSELAHWNWLHWNWRRST